MAESMTGLKRTHRCAELSEANIGEKVTIMGWVQKNRNKGGLVFVDVRDRSGLIQVVFEEGSTDKALLEKAAKLRSEFVVAIVGTVEKRSGAVNENLATGAIEIKPEELRILSESETPPFPIEENSKTKEEVRLKYRFLDLRRPDIQRNLIMRSKVAMLTREFMSKEGFLEIETPMLTKSTPLWFPRDITGTMFVPYPKMLVWPLLRHSARWKMRTLTSCKVFLVMVPGQIRIGSLIGC